MTYPNIFEERRPATVRCLDRIDIFGRCGLRQSTYIFIVEYEGKQQTHGMIGDLSPTHTATQLSEELFVMSETDEVRLLSD